MERWVEEQTEITSFHTELSQGTPLQTACVDISVYKAPGDSVIY